MNARTRRWLTAVCFISLFGLHATAQQQPGGEAFAPYTGCTIPGGPAVVETAPLDPGVTERSVRTLRGSSRVALVDGRRVMFAYPDEDFYANVKVEVLAREGYAEARAALLGNFDYLLASGDNARNYTLKPKLNGFNIQGLDRSKREGGVLGIYLLFDDARRTAITIYFLNQEPPKRFQTMAEYAVVRDHFLNGYTDCIQKGL